MKKKSRNLRYKLDYVTFWNKQGMYGQIRIDRMRARRRKRFEKWLQRKRDRKHQPWFENGRWIHHCEMGGTCEWPCNGDC